METSKFVQFKVLGEGSLGSIVSLVKPPNPNTDQLPPVLVLKSSSTNSTSSNFLLQEKEALNSLQGCSQIIKYFGSEEYKNNTDHSLSLLLEFAPRGTLRDLIKNSNLGLPEEDVKVYTLMILKGISHMHEKGYVHCDLKPSNILVFPCCEGFKNRLKISEFGLSLKAEVEKGIKVNPEMSYRGTALYNSPESVAFSKYEKPMDIWALGCIVIEMVTGKPSWKFNCDSDLLYELAFGEDSPEIPNCSENFSEDGVDFLIKCLTRDPGDRWTAKMLLDHPFVKAAEEELELLELEVVDEELFAFPPAPLGGGWLLQKDLVQRVFGY